MAVAAVLFLQKWWFTRFLLQGVIMHQRTKLDENAPIHGVEMALRWNQKWWPPPSLILVIWHFRLRDPIYGAILYLHTKFEPNPSILGEVTAIFPKSKVAAAAMFLQKWWFRPLFLLQGVILHQRIKFGENTPIHGVEMALWKNPNIQNLV